MNKRQEWRRRVIAQMIDRVQRAGLIDQVKDVADLFDLYQQVAAKALPDLFDLDQPLQGNDARRPVYLRGKVTALQPGASWSKHPNGGGWVADTASVEESAYVGPLALVYENARVTGRARIAGCALVRGDSQCSGDCQVYGSAIIEGHAQVMDSARVAGNVRVSGSVVVGGTTLLRGRAVFDDPKAID